LAQRAFADANFSAQPTWQGGAAETGAIARQQAQPLLAEWIARRGRGQGARLLARLIELAELPSRLKLRSGAVANVDVQAKVKTNTKAFTLDDNVGLSLVETSRGVLMHCVRLVDGKVADYRIVAPTEWNFHPAGPLQQALALLPADADIVARAQAICQSLDPCVAFEIDVVDLR
jgi:Ni,Fe-hydrogenase I large subunit